METQIVSSLPRSVNVKTAKRPAKLAIRPARFEDMAQIADFVRSSADWYQPIVDEADMGQHNVGPTWARENFERRNFYIGEANGVPVGTISLQYFGRYAYLGYIYLDVAHVGKGYGQELMRFAEQVARKLGMVGMALIAHPEAKWATRAYVKYGFEIVGARKEDVLRWQQGVLEPYYEQGFQLYVCTFADIIGHYAPEEIAARSFS